MNKKKLIELRCKAWGITEDEYYCNQCSDFSLEDMARAYRRGKNKGARDKAIQNVGFYQKQMQDIYDKKNKQIAELEARCNELFFQVNEKIAKIADLEKENKELKTRLRKKINVTTVSDYSYSALKLEEAKEIIREFVDNVERYSINNEILDRAEQFISEVEK